MAHMRLYADEGFWFVAETTEGSEVLPSDLVPRWVSLPSHEVMEALEEYCEGTVTGYEVRHGFCARYSAPGYLDCTPWCGPFDTEAEAIAECKRLHGDEEG